MHAGGCLRARTQGGDFFFVKSLFHTPNNTTWDWFGSSKLLFSGTWKMTSIRTQTGPQSDTFSYLSIVICGLASVVAVSERVQGSSIDEHLFWCSLVYFPYLLLWQVGRFSVDVYRNRDQSLSFLASNWVNDTASWDLNDVTLSLNPNHVADMRARKQVYNSLE